MVIDLQKVIKENKELKKKKKKDKGILKKKLLKKPTAKLPSYSAVKVVKGLASSTQPLVREVEYREPVEDRRSLFFKDEFAKERKEGVKWLS